MILRTVIAIALAFGGILGTVSPANAAKAPAKLSASASTATQGTKVTITMTASKYKSKYWVISYKKDGEWNSFCSGKPKSGKLKCSGTLPLEGTNTFRASCTWCTSSFGNAYTSTLKIKGKAAPGSPKNPVAKGSYLTVGTDSKKVGIIKVNSVNWSAASSYCSRFTNDDVYYLTQPAPCMISTTRPSYSDASYDSWAATAAIANSSYTGKLVEVSLSYTQLSGGSDYIPDVQFRQTDGSYVDSVLSHPGSTDPSDFYRSYEDTIQGVAVTRLAYFEVASSVNSGHVVIQGYSFGQFATRGLYSEAWMKTS